MQREGQPLEVLQRGEAQHLVGHRTAGDDREGRERERRDGRGREGDARRRGPPRLERRGERGGRVLNGIFWVLRSGAPWRDLPEAFGPYTTCYNRFVRWRRAGVWGRIIDALAAAHDAAVQMIDTSIVRVHQHGACITRNKHKRWEGREAG